MQGLPTILVVEDDLLIQSVVEDALKDGGFEIDIASSASQAIEKLDGADGKYRALVTDIDLGRDQVDGWEIARRAREIDPAFPVVYMSGASAENWASKGVPNSIMLSKGRLGRRHLGPLPSTLYLEPDIRWPVLSGAADPQQLDDLPGGRGRV
jgi:CheY-like chemotaxis protein